MIAYRTLRTEELCRALFASFRRRQSVTRCWRKCGGTWQIRDVSFMDDWTDREYDTLICDLRRTAEDGGLVIGAFQDGRLAGFAAVTPELFGKGKEYLDLASIHVSEDARRQGIGRRLFEEAKRWAASHGAVKLYISAHSAVESIAFYRAMGCVEAAEYNARHVAAEPFDCQLECPLDEESVTCPAARGSSTPDRPP